MTAHFSRMNARVDEDDPLAVQHRLSGAAARPQSSRIGKFRVELPVVIETAEIRWARNDESDKGYAQRGFTELPIIDAIAGLRERFVVADQHRPFDEFAIVPGVEAQDRSRGGYDRSDGPVHRGRRRRLCTTRGSARPLCLQRRRYQRGEREREQRVPRPHRAFAAVAGAPAAPRPSNATASCAARPAGSARAPLRWNSARWLPKRHSRAPAGATDSRPGVRGTRAPLPRVPSRGGGWSSSVRLNRCSLRSRYESPDSRSASPPPGPAPHMTRP